MNVDPEIVAKAYQASTWGNTRETPEDWLAVLEGGEDDDKRRLFNRIFREDPDGGRLRLLFEKRDIERYLKAMDTPLWRSDVEKRRKVWRYLYCGIREPIPELDWIIRS